MTESLHAQDLEAERLQRENDGNEATASAQGTAQVGSDSGQGNTGAMLEIQNPPPPAVPPRSVLRGQSGVAFRCTTSMRAQSCSLTSGNRNSNSRFLILEKKEERSN